jgi:hypothetical protein
MKIVVLLNGPPGVGKDTIAAQMCREQGVEHFEMKTDVYRTCANLFHIDEEDFRLRARDRYMKEQPAYWWGMSPRDMLIFASEQVVKPMYGSDYYGRCAAERVKNSSCDVAVFSDGGFDEELSGFLDAGYQVVVVRLFREGHTFEGDSRKYLYCTRNRSTGLDVVLMEGQIGDAVYDCWRCVKACTGYTPR